MSPRRPYSIGRAGIERAPRTFATRAAADKALEAMMAEWPYPIWLFGPDADCRMGLCHFEDGTTKRSTDFGESKG